MSGYQSYYQEAKASYDMMQTIDIDAAIIGLDTAVAAYSKDQNSSTLGAVEAAFSPISEYYSKLLYIQTNLQTYLEKATKDVAEGSQLNQERYENRIHPEESVKSREIMLGIVPTLKPSSIPYIMTASISMACLTIFMIFQMNGISGQLNLPPAFLAWWATPSTLTLRNPMVLGGIGIVSIAAAVIFGVLYYRAKNNA
jgi:hypothetical protein